MKKAALKGYSKGSSKKAGVVPSKAAVKSAKPSTIKMKTKKGAEAVAKKLKKSPMKSGY